MIGAEEFDAANGAGAAAAKRGIAIEGAEALSNGLPRLGNTWL